MVVDGGAAVVGGVAETVVGVVPGEAVDGVAAVTAPVAGAPAVGDVPAEALAVEAVPVEAAVPPPEVEAAWVTTGWDGVTTTPVAAGPVVAPTVRACGRVGTVGTASCTLPGSATRGGEGALGQGHQGHGTDHGGTGERPPWRPHGN